MVSTSTKTTKFSCIIQEMINTYKLHHLTIFMNNSLDINEEQSHYFLQDIVNQIPRVVIDLTEIKSNGDNRSIEMPGFQNPRETTVYVILQDEEPSLEEMYGTLDNVVAISPISTRPKCLLILNDGKGFSVETSKQILHYAWYLKLLDFTLLNVVTADNVTYFNYNPFMETYNTGYLESMINIFPDKLDNMINYTVKLPLSVVPPFLFFSRNNQRRTRNA